jgi:hypothetical protein
MAERLGLPTRQAMTKFDPMGRSAPRTGRPQGRGSAGSYLVGLLLPSGRYVYLPAASNSSAPARRKIPRASVRVCGRPSVLAAAIAAADWQHFAGDIVGATGAARNTKAGAICAGCAARTIGVSEPNDLIFSAGLSAGLSGVQTGSGATAFTWMRFVSRLEAKERAKA